MAKYVVVHEFADMQDGGFVYTAGDTYPRKGVKPSEIRVAELLSSTNRIGEPLISKSDGSTRKRAEVKPEEAQAGE